VQHQAVTRIFLYQFARGEVVLKVDDHRGHFPSLFTSS
jgi:hypothetical protein